MKKYLGILLVSILVVSFVVGVFSSDSQAAKGQCYTYCDGIYEMECCRTIQPETGSGWDCGWTGYYCM